jgi:hypothetical protein
VTTSPRLRVVERALAEPELPGQLLGQVAAHLALEQVEVLLVGALELERLDRLPVHLGREDGLAAGAPASVPP